MKKWIKLICIMITMIVAYSNVCQLYAETPTVDIVIPESDWPQSGKADSKKIVLYETDHSDLGPTEAYAKLVLPERAYLRLEMEMPSYQSAEISWDLLKEDKETIINSHDFKMEGANYTLDLFRGTLPAGTYYFRFHDIYVACTGVYGWQFHISTARYRNLSFEEDDLKGDNDSKETAQILEGPQYGYLSYLGDDPVDWYTFEVGEEGATLSLEGPNEFGDVSADLMREDGEYLESDKFVYSYYTYNLTEGRYYLAMKYGESSGDSMITPVRGGHYYLNLKKNKPQSTESGEDPGTGDDPGNGDEPGSGVQPGSGEEPSTGEQPGSGEEPGTGEQPGSGEDVNEVSIIADGAQLKNPRIEKADSLQAGQKVTYDCIWFGSYPQTEIVDRPETCGTYTKSWGKKTDYEVNPSLYKQLKDDKYWNNGDKTINGIKYHRISGKDTTKSPSSGDNEYYDWNDESSYHYFRYEKIKWRILNISDSKILLLSDQVLDDWPYEYSFRTDTWEKSYMRNRINYGFLNSVFTTSEQGIIKTTHLINDSNPLYGTSGGGETDDKIFLLSHKETREEAAAPYGFIVDRGVDDEARASKATTYAKAMGVSLDDNGNCSWWLRTPGSDGRYAEIVSKSGYVGIEGDIITRSINGVRPALIISYSDSLCSYAGTICSDGTINEVKYKQKVTVKPSVKVSKITLTGISKNIAAGKSVQLTATILPKNAASKKLKWTTSNSKVATVTQTGKVIIKKGTGGKSVTITATAADGSKKSASFQIKVMKGAVKKITIKGAKKTLKAGKTMKLKAVVKATKGANKKLKWSASNKKWATVNSKGVVKALKNGKGKKVTITVQSTDGTNKKKKISFKIK